MEEWIVAVEKEHGKAVVLPFDKDLQDRLLQHKELNVYSVYSHTEQEAEKMVLSMDITQAVLQFRDILFAVHPCDITLPIFRELTAELWKTIILAKVEEYYGNISAAAKRLKINRKTIYRLLNVKEMKSKEKRYKNVVNL